jgi:hypothetical protein
MPDLVCNLELEDLNKAGACENRASGVKTLYIALHDDVDLLPTLPNTRTHFEDFAVLSEGGDGPNHLIKMKAGKRMFKFATTKDLGELKYTVQGTSGGKSFNANLEVVHAGMKEKILGFMASVMNRELILLAKLNNGDVHMLGDKDRGAEFGDTAEVTSGKAVSDQNGATINFTYDTPTAQIYKGDNIDSLLVAEESGSGGA